MDIPKSLRWSLLYALSPLSLVATSMTVHAQVAGTGTIHSEKMHVVERYTLNNDGSLSWEARVEDPVVLTKPYATGAVFRAPIGVRVEEYECIENNPDPMHMKKAEDLEKAKK